MARRDTSAKTKDNTRRRIIAAAESLFGEKGLDAASVRDITAAADCNVAAINYYFGGKENLYRETMRRLLRDMRDEFIERIGDRRSRVQGPEELEAFLERFVSSALEMFGVSLRGRYMLAYCDREAHCPHGPPQDFLDEFLRPVMVVARDQLHQLALSVEADTARLCLMSLWSQLIVLVKTKKIADREEAPSLLRVDNLVLASHIVRFSAAGIRACAARSATGPERGGGPAGPHRVDDSAV